jgi:hypothetical protein
VPAGGGWRRAARVTGRFRLPGANRTAALRQGGNSRFQQAKQGKLILARAQK